MTRSSHQTVRRLTYFAAIAEAGSIRGGARVLGLSVPVVSAALSELEEELGVTLAARTTRSFELTPMGDTVRQASQEVMRAAEYVKELAHPTADKTLEGALAISVTTEIATHWLPVRIAAFSARYPAVRLHVDARDDVVPLKMSRFDLAIRMRGPLFQEDLPDMSSVPLACVSAPGLKPVRTDEGWSVDAPLLTASDSPAELFARTRDRREKKQVKFSSSLTVTNREAARRMAAEGLGAALVLADAARRDAERGDLVELLPELDFGEVGYRVLLRDPLPSPAARAFAALIEDWTD